MNPNITIYGIRNCSSMKKAFHWLDAHNLNYSFHDYKKSAIDRLTLRRWAARLGEARQLVNKRGTSWRKLSASEQAKIDGEQLFDLLIEHTSLIRRPILERADATLLFGFDETIWRQTLLERD